MPRAQSDLNSPFTFVKGFVTEANRLAESENMITNGNNIFINRDGSCERRLGFDIELAGSLVSEAEAVLTDDKAVKSVTWKNVNGDPSKNFVITQMGDALHFFDASVSPLSDGYIGAVSMAPYAVSPSVATEPISIATTAMAAVIANKYCDPLWVLYDSEEATLEVSALVLKIRDFAGIPDGLKISERPEELSVAHLYNLLNQGWADIEESTSPDYTGNGTATGGDGFTGGGTDPTDGSEFDELPNPYEPR